MNARQNSADLPTLAELAKLGAARGGVVVSSAALGKAMGVTQQAASRRLVILEGSGLIVRSHAGRGLRVALTPAGRRKVLEFYSGLRAAFEEEEKLDFTGKVFRGLGEGGYYVSLKGYALPFRRALGFIPFPGTLNLRLEEAEQIAQRARLPFMEGVEVRGFKDGRRTFGPVKCFRAVIEGKHAGAVLAIERTHYDDTVLEVISPLDLRRTLGLKDGDPVHVSALLR
ncbi:MAG: DUF120 domain-containing protein [archaeon]|nr:MAG: DUF120 domain-containing protein [archaeon]